MERPVFVCPHVCVIVPDIMEAFDFYQRLLGVEPVRCIARVRDRQLFQAAGFPEYPRRGEAAVCFLRVPGAGLTLQLMEYDPPQGQTEPVTLHAEGVNGARQVTVGVEDIDGAFAHVRTQGDVRLEHRTPSCRTDLITCAHPRASRPLPAGPGPDPIRVLSAVRYFCFTDKYGLQWTFTQGHREMPD